MKLVPQGSNRLRHFQEHFQRALVAADGEPMGDCGAAMARLVAQPAFAVYRNTVLKGCIDALQANYPAVTRLVGEEWLRAAAAVFARANPPVTPMLLDYGDAFAGFLQDFAPAAELPYLADVARLDRFWNEAHTARDETAVEPGALAGLTQDELALVSLRPHASARWAWFEAEPIFTLWSRNRTASADTTDIAWHGEGALIVRPFDAVQSFALGRAGCAFLDACAGRQSLTAAASAALAADATADLVPLMTQLFGAGAFGRIDIDPHPQ